MSKASQQPEKSKEVQQLEADVRALREVKQTLRPINQSRVGLAQSVRNVFRAVSQLEDTIEQITDPKYWVHMQHQLRPLDRIEVVPDDRRFFLELLVLSSQMNHVTVAVIHKVELPHVELGPEIPSKYKVTYAGPHEQFRVLEDDRVLVTQKGSADEAKRWLMDHLKSMQL